MPTATRATASAPAATAAAAATRRPPNRRSRRPATPGPTDGPATARTDNSASVPAAGSSDTRVRAALATGPNLTVLDIAQTTGLGRSTVGKALNRLAATGHATRTPPTGTGPTRTPEQWNLGPADYHASTEKRPSTGDGDTDSGAVEAPPVGTTTPTPDTASPAQPASRGQIAAGPSTGDGAGNDLGDGGDVTRNPVTGTVKLAPGTLTGLVAGHFAAHPATALTAGEVGRALNRSGGAVRNACDRLVRDGDLTVAADSPRRYTLATAS